MAFEVVMFDRLARSSPSHIYTEGDTVFFHAIVVFKHEQRLGKTAANVFLGEVDRACVGHSQVHGQLLDEKVGETVVLFHKTLNERHGQKPYGGVFKGRGRRNIIFAAK